MVYSKRDNTKKNILDSAIKLFDIYGYNATTTSSIAKDACVSEAIIFKYFKSKDKLLREIGLHAIKRIIEDISINPLIENIEQSKNKDIIQFIKNIIYERLDFINKYHSMIKMLIIEMQYSDEIKNMIIIELFPKVFELYIRFQNIIIEKSNLNTHDANAIARIILGFIQSISLQQYIFGIEINQDKIDHEVNGIINIIKKIIYGDRRDETQG